MKIAYIALRGIPLSDGIAQYTDDMATRLVQKGHSVTIYTSKRYGNKTGFSDKGYYIQTVPSLKSPFIEKLSITLFASIHQIFKKYDVVHYHAMGPSIFAFLAKKRFRAVIIQSHGVEYNRAKFGPLAKKTLSILEKFSINMGDTLLVCSNSLHQHFIEKYTKNTIVIHNGVNLPSLNNINYSLLKERDLIPNEYYLFMARITEEKGLTYLINAFKSTHIVRKLVIAGYFDINNKFHKYLSDLTNGDERIIFVGNISGELKETLLKGAYAFVLPSESEGFSVALLEAMSYQKCCIVSDIPSNKEAVNNCGLIFKSKDTDDLEKILMYADEKKDFVLELGILARKEVEKNYSLDTIADKTEKLYMDILNKKRLQYEKNK